MSAIPVFLRDEDPAIDRPRHSASKLLSLHVLSACAAKWTDASRTAIQLVTNETWKACKNRCRPSNIPHRLLPPTGFVYSGRDFLSSNTRFAPLESRG